MPFLSIPFLFSSAADHRRSDSFPTVLSLSLGVPVVSQLQPPSSITPISPDRRYYAGLDLPWILVLLYIPVLKGESVALGQRSGQVKRMMG